MFYIHILNGTGMQRDEVGQDFPNARLAVAEACKTVGELMHDETLGDGGGHEVRLTVEDEGGAQISLISGSISFTM